MFSYSTSNKFQCAMYSYITNKAVDNVLIYTHIYKTYELNVSCDLLHNTIKKDKKKKKWKLN